MKSLKVEVGCSFFFHPLWECSAVGPAAAAWSSGVCPLDTAWRKCAVLFCHGPAWMGGKRVGPVPGKVRSQC